MSKILRPLLVSFALLLLLTGVVYPSITTLMGRIFFPDEVSGSLIKVNGQWVGSSLMGQSFTQPNYFWGRPSATSPRPYDATNSGGSNLGPTNPALQAAVKERISALKQLDPHNTQPIPVDLVTASGSGLDPHISPEAAFYQVARVARVRQLPAAKLQALVQSQTEGRQWGIFGEPRVNVLKLNLALDALK